MLLKEMFKNIHDCLYRVQVTGKRCRLSRVYRTKGMPGTSSLQAARVRRTQGFALVSETYFRVAGLQQASESYNFCLTAPTGGAIRRRFQSLKRRMFHQMRRVLVCIFAVALLCCIAPVAQAADWVYLGQPHVDGQHDHDNITVGGE